MVIEENAKIEGPKMSWRFELQDGHGYITVNKTALAMLKHMCLNNGRTYSFYDRTEERQRYLIKTKLLRKISRFYGQVLFSTDFLNNDGEISYNAGSLAYFEAIKDGFERDFKKIVKYYATHFDGGSEYGI